MLKGERERQAVNYTIVSNGRDLSPTTLRSILATMCCLFMCFSLPLDIAGFAIWSEEKSDPCRNPNSFVDVGDWLLVGSIIHMIGGGCSLVLTYFLMKSLESDSTGGMTSVLALSAMFNIFYLTWSILGFVVYSSNPKCDQQPIGKMMLAWSIIIFIGTLCQLCGGASPGAAPITGGEMSEQENIESEDVTDEDA